MLTHLHCPPDVTPTLPPISAQTTPYASHCALTPPYAFSHPPLTILMLASLKMILQCHPPYSNASTPLPLPRYPQPLTILTLA
ncbi:hypothetical protein O181_029481 [Austropuccinia psidii MF-1]|uniref:Uncharacterized protein n=1 Tax=Austropuccinia psidii MF-1 TaxID=1389203 RepID=A0A9Q3CR41_9BASI|nr:hypothetical protein [Austropuccinia psidii MF-1]